jgi:hypothetical protein
MSEAESYVQMARACGCGKPVKLFASSGRYAKACSRPCLQALAKPKMFGMQASCAGCAIVPLFVTWVALRTAFQVAKVRVAPALTVALAKA